MPREVGGHVAVPSRHEVVRVHIRLINLLLELMTPQLLGLVTVLWVLDRAIVAFVALARFSVICLPLKVRHLLPFISISHETAKFGDLSCFVRATARTFVEVH